MTHDCKITSSVYSVTTEFEVRHFVDDDGVIWFVGKDVANALGYQDTDQAIRDHVDEEDKKIYPVKMTGQVRKITVINESGLYNLIFGSKLPSAKKFKRWVTGEVLPSIRKYGRYEMPNLKGVSKTDTPDVEILPPVEDFPAQIEREKFLIEAWNWFETIIDTESLTASEQLVIFYTLKNFYENFYNPVEMTVEKISKMTKKDSRTVKKVLTNLMIKRLFPPPFTLADFLMK